MSEGIKYQRFSEEAYQSLLKYIVKQVRLDVNKVDIKDSYRHAVKEKKISLEYSGYDYVPVMDLIEKATLSWAKLYANVDFFVTSGKCGWMVKNIVGSFTYTTNRLFVDLCEANNIDKSNYESSRSE